MISTERWNLLEHKEISHKSYAKPKDIFLCKMVSVGHIAAEHNWVVEHLRRRHHQNDRTTDIYGDRDSMSVYLFLCFKLTCLDGQHPH